MCLWSLQDEELPRDRPTTGRAPREPFGVGDKAGMGGLVVHRCTACAHRQPNRLVREGEAPDAVDLVLSRPWR